MKAKKLTLMAVLSAIALTIFIAEAQIPPIVPVPGMKLGLANIVTLLVMAYLGRKEAGIVLLVRILMGSVFAGSVSALIFSLAGGILAYLAMALLIGLFSDRLLWVVSIFGAIAHNAGQLAAAVFVTKTAGLLYYAPALLAAAIITGVFTGVAAMYLLRAIQKLNLK
ncbi:MAG: Gx transporter family protein [Oscillospiraceae bacterium]|jgi:heptaprenyl diphosphate synthase